MGKKIKIIILIVFCLYVFFYKSQTYISPNKWRFTQKENEIGVMVGRSLNFIKWTHSYERVENNLYIKIYLVPYINPFNRDYGPLYFFNIPENLEEIENIYTYDNDGNLILVYPKSEVEQ